VEKKVAMNRVSIGSPPQPSETVGLAGSEASARVSIQLVEWGPEQRNGVYYN
jgi:hypothetical protein